MTALAEMARRMVHRGPDGAGFHVDGALGLAHRRLSIIDLDGGAQPMSTSDGELWISYNGEVFNYPELFEELRRRGHVPRTHSDTEAVLLAYREWGVDFVEHLNGMFAIAIWDKRRRRLVLARDRMGVKPLYYAETRDGIAFASELKALRLAPGVDTSLDLEALDDYMTLGYVVNPRCLLSGVKKLEPGVVLTVDPERGLEQRRYWQLRFEPDERPTRQEWVDDIRRLFDDSVRLRLRSDVPVGLLLSGGIDSTAIAATVERAKSTRGVHSYCIGVDAPGAENEFKWAQLVAKKLGTQHHEVLLSAEENGTLLTEAATLLDEPLVEPCIAQLLGVCRLARKDVTVVLSGEGADETWLGYQGYRTMYGIELGQRLVPSALLNGVSPLLHRLAEAPGISTRTAKYLRLATEPLERRYLGLSGFDTAVKDRLYSTDTRRALLGHDSREAVRRLYDGQGGPETPSRMAAVDCRGWLVDNTLMRSDLMSMAASVELRVPFLDYRLVSLAARVPARFKLSLTSGKVILKEALADRIPQEVLRRRKVGFPTPTAALLRGEWGRQAQELLESPSARTAGLFDQNVLRGMIAQHRSGAQDWHRVLFQVLMLEYWSLGVGAPQADAA
ncbi:MAG: hypothetical protein RJA70_4476 [Pseudomonadota bacterium]